MRLKPSIPNLERPADAKVLRYSITNDGTVLYIKTNKDAPQHHIVTVDLADPKRERRVLIPEDKDANLVSIKPVNHNKLVVVYKRNVSA